jgi:hypothetical protein
VPALLPSAKPRFVAVHSGSDEGPFPGYEPDRFGGGGDPEEAERRPVPVGPLVRAPRRGIDGPPPLEEEVPPEAQASVLARAAVVGDIQVFRNLSLKSASMPVASSLVQGDGGEESVATNGRGTVIYAMNWTAAISSDGGGTFSLLSPTKLFDNAAGGFCCDQVVTYIPQVDRFVWVMQYSAGQAGVANSARPNLLRVATATSAELANYDGQRWPGVYYNFGPSSFKSLKSPARGESIFLDRPFMAFTRSMLYFTVSANNVGGTPSNGTLVWRVPVAELGGTVKPRSAFLGGPSFVRPAQGALPLRGSTQYFGQRATTSRLNIFAWPDNSTSITRYEADVPSTGNADLASNAPAGNDWLLRAGGQVSQVSTGAATRGGTVWFGWLAGREAVYDVNGKQRRDRVHDQPTIEFAGFRFEAGRPVRADYDTIEFADYATALPELRAGQGGLGLSFMFGGPTFGPAHAVGFLRPSYAMALTIRNRIGTSGYGDYVGLAQNPRERRCYVAAGSSAMPPNDADPHFVIFGRKNAGCTVPPRSPRVPTPTLFRPDLLIDSITPNASNSAVEIALFNFGRADAAASKLGVAFDGGTETLYDVPALATGASTTITAPCPTGSVGASSVTARLDATGFVDESDETNNAFTRALAGCRTP